jgi:SAM-dependent methyltransferase
MALMRNGLHRGGSSFARRVSLQLPDQFSDDPLLARGLRAQEAIEQILDAAGFLGLRRVIDYGGGNGSWVWRFPGAVVYDTDESELAPGRALAAANNLDVTFTSQPSALGPADGIVSVAVQQLMSDAQLREFFDHAHALLVPGGKLLLTVMSPRTLLRWLVRLERVRLDGLFMQLMWLHRLTFSFRRVGHGARTPYCLRAREATRVAEEHGFRLISRLPGSVNDLYCEVFGRVRYNWLVFERP